MQGAQISRPPAQRITAIQIVTLLAMWAGLRTWDPLLADSAALGGLVAVIPQAWFSWRVFQARGARSVRRIARSSYAAEAGKFFLAVTGFVLVFALVRPLTAWAVFAGYGVMLIIQVIGAIVLLRAATGDTR